MFYCLSVYPYHPGTLAMQSAVSHQQSAISHQLSAVGCQLSIINQKSTIKNPKSPIPIRLWKTNALFVPHMQPLF